MHAPLPRNSLPRRMREEDSSDATRALVRTCAFVVILAVTLVSTALSVGELTAGPHSARDGAPSPRALFGLIQPP